jgi:hypothetical protein
MGRLHEGIAGDFRIEMGFHRVQRRSKRPVKFGQMLAAGRPAYTEQKSCKFIDSVP